LRWASAKISSGSSEPSMWMCSSALGMAAQQRGQAITDEGHEVLAIAERLLTEAENLKSVGRELRGADTGVLRLAATHTQARYVLPPAVVRLREAFPGVRLQLRQGSPAQIVAMLRAGRGRPGRGHRTAGQDRRARERGAVFVASLRDCALGPPGAPA
jgi:DNA-binding transcriptional LysR family regulator